MTVGLDTNVLVRYLVKDDKLQFERARRLIEREARKVCFRLKEGAGLTQWAFNISALPGCYR
jgi:hypothetical protein